MLLSIGTARQNRELENPIQELASNRSEWSQLKTSPTFTTELFPANKRREPIQANPCTPAHSCTWDALKDLDKLAKNITQFNRKKKRKSSTEDHNIYSEIRL